VQTARDDLLPPAGHARREELKRRLESLQAEIEALPDDQGRIDPSKLEIDREVAVHFSGPDAELFISKADPNYRYTWVYRDPYNRYGGRFVRSYQVDGWEIVDSGCVEAREHRAVDGTRWVADCLLMRMRCDHHAALHLKRFRRRVELEHGIASNLQELADKKGVKIHTSFEEMPAHLQSAVESSSSGLNQRRQYARQMAATQFDKAIRAGKVPGMPAPGDRRS
jgi:hypothetical protein